MAQPLMPKATAVWLIDNTALTFEQIAAFVGLHPLEVQAIADGEVSTGIQGFDPVLANQVTRAEIARCEGNPKERLRMATSDLPKPVQKTKGPKYIRSEEHTSELQSLMRISYAVFCLKNKKKQ